MATYELGIDFGTTNTALTAFYDDGTQKMAHFTAMGDETICRTALFFTEPEEGKRKPGCSIGDEALRDCIESEGEGRFIQSLKTFLASRNFGATQIYYQKFTLEELVTRFLAALRDKAISEFGGMPKRIRVGAPVQFAYAQNDDDNAFARERLQNAFSAAKWGDISFALEPVAAAFAYQARIEKKSLVMVADFGGGTSDFALVQLEPGEKGEAKVLGTSGVAVAGDNLDAKIVRHLVAPALGRGTRYAGFDGIDKEIPPPFFAKLERWHHLSFMNNKQTLQKLRNVQKEAFEPERIGKLIELIEDNLGFHLHDAIRRTKRALSLEMSATFSFNTGSGVLEAEVTRAEFEAWIEPEIDAIDQAIHKLFVNTECSPDKVDAVFMTGGTSFVPAIRALLSRRFSEDSLQSGDELVSIAHGLARMAHHDIEY
ncbi:MAG: Hsp70 family protein [Deltaproteobacteria bacterium]|nr:Hsp70 family protein [Deltaproteobacteria bacterium]